MNHDSNSFVDLHIHSVCSDGSCTPEEIVSMGKEKGLKALALTDHDTTDGTEAMTDACRRAGILTIPGIELSCTWKEKSIHILGYGMDYKAAGFQDQLTIWQKDREERNQKITEKLAAGGYDISMEKLHRHFPGAVLTRAHIAVYLTVHKMAADKNQVFSRLIGKGCPFYVPRKPVTPEKAIRFLLSYGGIPVFAHPILSRMCEIQLDAFTGLLRGLGLKGIEGFYSGYSAGDTAQIKRLAGKYDLFLTGGSDFHGTAKPDISLGTGKGTLKVPYLCFENLIS